MERETKMAGMKMPEWYTAAKEQLTKVVAEPPPDMAELPEMEKLTDLSHVFAEYCIKDNDVLLHLFPRAGLEDQWTEGHYINRCRKCRTEVPMPKSRLEMKPCPRCGHAGLIYIPGRAEEATKVTFPKGVEHTIKRAVDVIWMGDVAIESVPELGAYVVQFQGAKSAAESCGVRAFVRQACAALSDMLFTVN